MFPYSKYKDYNIVQLIALAQVLMTDRHYFDVQRYFCESDFSFNVYNPDGKLLTVDGAHLSHHGKKELIKRLFSDEHFLRLWAGLKVR